MNEEYPTIISFYTQSWEYAKHAKRLEAECDRLGLAHYIKEYPDTGNWLYNTRIKASFIYDAITTLKRPVLWIDVDGSIYQTPDFTKLPTELDFMGHHQRIGPRRTWHVGTMFFNYTDKMLEFLKLWKESTENIGGGSDENTFEIMWLEHNERIGLTSVELPKAYFVITSINYNTVGSTIIEHRLSRCPNKMGLKKNNKLGVKNNA